MTVTHAVRWIPSRILLLAPVATLFYVNQCLALRRAFLAKGLECLFMADGMDDDAMEALLSGYEPDVVLSINSYKRPLMERFPEVLHVRWIQDNHFIHDDYRKKTSHPLSDICYCVSDRQKRVVVSEAKTLSGILRFAADPAPDCCSEAPRATFSLIGGIPPASLLGHEFKISVFRRFVGRDYFEFLASELKNSLDMPLEQLDAICMKFLARHRIAPAELGEIGLGLLREDYIRAFNRSRLVQRVLSIGMGCNIYGNREWADWPEFAEHYKGGAATSRRNQEIFRSTTLNLHNGGTISHPRVFECMGSFGGPLLANQMPPEPDLDFEPGVHYVEFNHDNLPDVAKELIADPVRRKTICQAAYKLICEKHTWDHRASQVLADIAR